MTQFWPIVPAAGVGARMQADRPKQYLPLAGQALMDHTLRTLLTYPRVTRLVLVLSEQDPYIEQSQFAHDERVIRAVGGDERVHSVLNGLQSIAALADDEDWVLVHDVARPCLTHSDLDGLISAVINQSPQSGGLLATPTRDTMKRGALTAEGLVTVQQTVAREQLWHALTPQMFRYGLLKQALQEALANGLAITDESSAMEAMGYQPLLVEGRADNIKVTRPADLVLAGRFLSDRNETSSCE
ncbi:MAG: 2-C-methyl-D-erythritol 4-phosphate cytidylyltransferase [Bacterioplanes sp.]|nr:2-C-methyl-D-erythritol 4-phosphate cytidylyltransferase [Bacterioplanes sp.]